MNNTEGLRCIQLAEKALGEEDLTTAERLCLKAKRMLSEKDSPEARQRLHHLYEEVQSKKKKKSSRSESPSDDLHPPTSTATREATHPHHTTRHQTTPSRGPRPNSQSTSQDLEAKCQAIVRSKDYYQILGLPRHADSEDIKKAYRKLALQLHPDKAKCPSAEAAFKMIAKAYQCLSDPEARKYFDTYGIEKTPSSQSSGHDFTPYDENFMSAEELFSSIFGVQFFHHDSRGPTRIYRVHPPSSHGSARSTGSVSPQQFYGLLQILPLILILVMSLLSNLFSSSSTPPFSLSRTSECHIPRTTYTYQLPYYVKSNFHRSFPEDSDLLRNLEHQIELNYFLSECNYEKQPILQQLQRLQFYGTNSQYNRKAEELRRKDETSSNCRNYRKLKEKLHYRSTRMP